MKTSQTGSNLSRRDFLKMLGIAAPTAVGVHLLDTYAPWVDYEEEVSNIARPFGTETGVSAKMKDIVRYTTLAANGHNTQPWKFAIKENEIEIHPDFSRQLSVVDPNHRELWISLGCALENLLISARAAGFAPQVSYPEAADFIRVELEQDTPQASTLFDAIPMRQNTRSEYDGQAIRNDQFDQLQAEPLEPGVKLQFVTNPVQLETVVDYVNQGNLNQYADEAFVDELIHWLRFNKKESIRSYDGLYSICSGNPSVPGWLGRMFVASTKPQQQADLDAAKLRSSSGAIIIASESDDKSTLVRTGQIYERLALRMTAMDIKSAFLNQPIEVVSLRSDFQTAMGLGADPPQLLVRYGYAPAMSRSLRRPIDQVLI